MNELITIRESNGKKLVSARDLYESLGFDESQWSRWYKKNITGNMFSIENDDYVQLDTKSRYVDFALSIDFAKRLSMLARTETGEKIRQYFIAMEKQAVTAIQSLEPEEMLLRQVQMMIDQKKRLVAVENDVKQLKAASQTRPNYFTIVGYATIHRMSIGLKQASALGVKAASICRKNGYTMDEVPDPRFGRVRSYPCEVLDEVFNMAII